MMKSTINSTSSNSKLINAEAKQLENIKIANHLKQQKHNVSKVDRNNRIGYKYLFFNHDFLHLKENSKFAQ